jgi:hypothetical protein
MITAIFAVPLIALVAWISYRAGKHRMARDAVVVMRMVESGEARVQDDGTVRMADNDHIEAQRVEAPWQ